MYPYAPIFAAAMTVLTVQLPALAQDQAASGSSTQSYFRMFFVSKDIIGQIIILVLVVMSVITLAYLVKLFIKNRRTTMLPQKLYDQVEQMIAQKKFREAIETVSQEPSYLGKLVNSAMHEAVNGYVAMERTIEEVSDTETTRMLRPIEYLNVIGNISPMLGLFGTVYGMIVAFQTLVEAGGRPEPQELAAGISTALVTTLWGLIVAMPALAGYAVMRNKVDALGAEGLVMAEQLIRPFKGAGKNPAASKPATPKVNPQT